MVPAFEGSKAETKTMLPVITSFMTAHQLPDVTIVADGGMVSEANQKQIEAAGLSFILGARIPDEPYVVKRWRREHPGEQIPDGHIFTQPWPAGPNGGRRDQWIFYQYRADRARRALGGTGEQVAKAGKAVAGQVPVKRNRFIRLSGGTRTVNRELEDKARALAGLKGYVTSLRTCPDGTLVTPEFVIGACHQLFQIERSFRMAKSDLQARPVYHRTRDSIEAHLTIVLAALAVSRWIEARTGWSIRKFVKTARRYAPSRSKPETTSSPPPTRYLTTFARPSRPSTPAPEMRTSLAEVRPISSTAIRWTARCRCASATTWSGAVARTSTDDAGESTQGGGLNSQWNSEVSGVRCCPRGNRAGCMVAELLGQRNAIDAQLAEVIGRPVASGHLGEWLAAEIFDVNLHPSARGLTRLKRSVTSRERLALIRLHHASPTTPDPSTPGPTGSRTWKEQQGYGPGDTSTSASCNATARSSTARMTARSFSQKPSGTGCSAARVKPWSSSTSSRSRNSRAGLLRALYSRNRRSDAASKALLLSGARNDRPNANRSWNVLFRAPAMRDRYLWSDGLALPTSEKGKSPNRSASSHWALIVSHDSSGFKSDRPTTSEMKRSVPSAKL